MVCRPRLEEHGNLIGQISNPRLKIAAWSLARVKRAQCGLVGSKT